jgi:hypothetical protein
VRAAQTRRWNVFIKRKSIAYHERQCLDSLAPGFP